MASASTPNGLAPSPHLSSDQASSQPPTPGPPTGAASFPNPNVQGNPYIYLAVYSSVPVYEMMVRGIGVMRRRSDSFLNATQILKVAGVDKGKRTKILEKDIALGVHEKVQGGYGRYQGTWIPFERAVELATQFGVQHLLAPLFEYTAPPAPPSLSAAPGQTSSPSSALNPSRYQTAAGTTDSASTVLNKAREQGLLPSPSPSSLETNGLANGKKRTRESIDGLASTDKRTKLANSVAAVSLALKKSTRPPVTSVSDDPTLQDRHKAILKNIFSVEPAAHEIPDYSQTFPLGLDADTAIDDNQHTALHWAAALARVPIVRGLVNFGADPLRGNNVGETPLIRAVLVTNNSDTDSFPALLEVLGPSIRTTDDEGRTVLHHAALVAGVKGRASSARYYMESVLEYVAKYEGGEFAELVDAKDRNGDTALNIAARVGNRGLVRILLEVGADKRVENKLGLRPGDFGVETEELAVGPGEDAVYQLAAPVGPPPPAQKSNDVLASLTTMLTSLNQEFNTELEAKSAVLETTRAQLRTSTKDLAEHRKKIATWRSKVTEVEEKEQRIRNLERALEEEDGFDWTGRTGLDGAPAPASAGPGFTYRGPASTLSNLPVGITIEFEADPGLPASDDAENALVHLIRLKAWYGRVMGLLLERIEALQGGNKEKEAALKKVVAGCCGVDVTRIDGMLEGLLAALESDGTSLDLTRVASFLQRVKDRSMAETA